MRYSEPFKAGEHLLAERRMRGPRQAREPWRKIAARYRLPRYLRSPSSMGSGLVLKPQTQKKLAARAQADQPRDAFVTRVAQTVSINIQALRRILEEAEPYVRSRPVLVQGSPPPHPGNLQNCSAPAEDRLLRSRSPVQDRLLQEISAMPINVEV